MKLKKIKNRGFSILLAVSMISSMISYPAAASEARQMISAEITGEEILVEEPETAVESETQAAETEMITQAAETEMITEEVETEETLEVRERGMARASEDSDSNFRVTTADGETGYFVEIEDVVEYVGEKTATITMLDSYEINKTHEFRLENVSDLTSITIDLNGNSLSTSSWLTFMVLRTLIIKDSSPEKTGYMSIIKNSFYNVGTVIIENGTFDINITAENIEPTGIDMPSPGTFIIKGGYFKQLNLGNSIGKTTITSGYFEKISHNDKKLSQYLEPGYDFYTEQFGGVWFQFAASLFTEYTEVEVKKIPITITDLSATQNDMEYGKADEATLSVTVIREDEENTDEITYQWYCNNEVVNTGTGFDTANYTLPADLDAGSYTYYCKVQCSKYEPDKREINISVNRINPKEDDLIFTEPYNLCPDGLPKAASVTAKPGITGLGEITVSYKKEGTETYTTEAPTEAGTYEVYAAIGLGKNYFEKNTFLIGSFTVEMFYRVSLTSRVDGASDGTTVALLTGGGIYDTNTEVTISAPEQEGYTFRGWYQASEDETGYQGNPVAATLTYVFSPTDDVDLVAVYESNAKVELNVSGNQFTVNSGTVQGMGGYVRQFRGGTKITLQAVGENFVYWKDSSNRIVSKSANYTFTLVRNSRYVPVYTTSAEYTALVEYTNYYDQILQVATYSMTDQIFEPVAPSRVGYHFTGWSVSEAQIQEMIRNGTSYVRVTPLYEQDTMNYNVMVRYRGIEKAEESYTGIAAGSTLTLTAGGAAVMAVTDDASDVTGKKFSHWSSDAEGIKVLSTSEEYMIIVAKDMEVYANYVDADTEVARFPVVAITNVFTMLDGEAKKLSFTATRDIPEDYVLEEQGMIYGTAETLNAENMIIGGAGVLLHKSSSLSAKGIFTLNIDATKNQDKVVYARGYAIVKNKKTGNSETYYSDIASGSYASVSQEKE